MDAALAEPVDDTLLVEGPEGEITFVTSAPAPDQINAVMVTV
jgi:hypothetical protein